MRVLISAAETSSDAHAAELLLALRKQLDERGESLEVFGIGGPKLLAAGLEQIVDARELLSMGFSEIVGRLPKIFQALSRIEKEAKKRKPDVAVFLDYPDFHFQLARRLGKQKIPLVYYIPPKVWAWRKYRVQFLKKFFAKILCILPFEEKFYQQAGVAAQYVGNPLLDELPLKNTRKDARQKLGLEDSELVLAVLAGSRPAELDRHLELFLDGAQMAAAGLLAAGKILSRDHRLKTLLPFPEMTLLEPLIKRVKAWECEQNHLLLNIRVSQGDSSWTMLAADVGLIKSGTSTLEAAMLGCPHIIIYNTNLVTEFLVRKVISYWGPIGLSNLVAGATVEPFPIPELTGKEVTPRLISDHLLKLLLTPDRMKKNIETCLRVRELMMISAESPSQLAARQVIGVVDAS